MKLCWVLGFDRKKVLSEFLKKWPWRLVVEREDGWWGYKISWTDCVLKPRPAVYVLHSPSEKKKTSYQNINKLFWRGSLSRTPFCRFMHYSSLAWKNCQLQCVLLFVLPPTLQSDQCPTLPFFPKWQKIYIFAIIGFTSEPCLHELFNFPSIHSPAMHFS